MKIWVNGEAREVAATTLAGLCKELELEAVPVATALNGAFVPASARETTTLKDGDKIEILSPRQGG